MEKTLDAHVQHLPGGLETLVGPASPDAAASLDRELGVVGATIFPPNIDVLVDCGRVLSGARGQEEILKAADQVVAIVRPDPAGIAHALWTLDLVRSLATGGRVSVAVLGPSSFQVGEMKKALQVRLLGVIAFDHKSAAMVCGSPGRPKAFVRSPLVASARRLVESMLNQPGIGDEPSGGTELADDQLVLETAIGRTSISSRIDLPTPGGNGAGAG
jgi:MinD-like ATPase involved in chromosome partitioning or flagellar assembly